MRVAVISDIHSNIHALEAVLEDIARSAVDIILCAGDTVGYGASPNECCAKVMRAAEHAVLGNHDEAALTGDVSGMNPFAADAARWTKKMMDPGSVDYLTGLPVACKLDLCERGIAMYHGSVDSTIEYVYEQEVSQTLLERAGADILILGHTHVPYIISLERGLAVNPGSVGQPRDLDPRASYAVAQLPEMECQIRRVRYDVEAAVESIEGAGLPGLLGSRLRSGR